MSTNTSAQLAAAEAASASAPVAAPRYRRLVRQWWRWKFDEAWLAPDHVLIVRTRFFNERYLRLYWADIAALLFFPSAQNNGLTLAGEWICLLAPALLLLTTGIVSIDRPSGGSAMVGSLLTTPRIAGLTTAVSAMVLYAIWRFTRRRWSVEIVTSTGRARVPLAITRSRSARYLELLTQKVEAVNPRVQPPAPRPEPEPPLDGGEVVPSPPAPTAFLPRPSNEKQPVVALHAAVFLLGIAASGLNYVTIGSPWYPMYIFAAIVFYLGLPILFFLQQGPEFPFTVRCAAVLNMVMGIAALLGLAAVFAFGGGVGVSTLDPRFGNLVNLLRILCCLFGIMCLWKEKLDRDSAPLPPQRDTVN